MIRCCVLNTEPYRSGVACVHHNSLALNGAGKIGGMS